MCVCVCVCCAFYVYGKRMACLFAYGSGVREQVRVSEYDVHFAIAIGINHLEKVRNSPIAELAVNGAQRGGEFCQ